MGDATARHGSAGNLAIPFDFPAAYCNPARFAEEHELLALALGGAMEKRTLPLTCET